MNICPYCSDDLIVVVNGPGDSLADYALTCPNPECQGAKSEWKARKIDLVKVGISPSFLSELELGKHRGGML